MLTSLLSPFVAASALGLLLSMVVHLCAWLSIPSPLGRYTWLLHVGIFLVWFPTVLVSQRLTREYRAEDFWKAALLWITAAQRSRPPVIVARFEFTFDEYLAL